jgi:hypothetical protein
LPRFEPIVLARTKRGNSKNHQPGKKKRQTSPQNAPIGGRIEGSLTANRRKKKANRSWLAFLLFS